MIGKHEYPLILPFINDPVFLFTYFKHWSNKIETMHLNSDGTNKFLAKISFVSNFGKSVVLILYHQLPFLQSGRSPGTMNSTGAQQVYPVLLKYKTHLKI